MQTTKTIIISDLDDTLMASNNKFKNFCLSDHYGPRPFTYLISIIREISINAGAKIYYLTASPLIAQLGYLLPVKHFHFRKKKWLELENSPSGELINPTIMPRNKEHFKTRKAIHLINKVIEEELENNHDDDNQVLQVIMFGDSGERDPYAYMNVKRHFMEMGENRVRIFPFIRRLHFSDVSRIPDGIVLFNDEEELMDMEPLSEMISEEIKMEIRKGAKKLVIEYNDTIYNVHKLVKITKKGEELIKMNNSKRILRVKKMW